MNIRPPKLWYALYTRSKHEKKICFYLQQQNIESFLPMTYVIRQWSDRNKKVIVPLFPSYVFVHISPKKLWRASDLPGAVRFVGIGKMPKSIPDAVIESLKKVEKEKVCVEDLGLYKGEKVRITNGEFTGVEGAFVRKGSKNMLAIAIEIMNRVVLLELDSTEVHRLEKVNTPMASI